jgi:hypothetical protein
MGASNRRHHRYRHQDGRHRAEETATLREQGRSVKLVTVPVREMPHDRWFRVDDEWWHSGASLKDLGLRVSRISKVDSAEGRAHDSMLEVLLRSANTPGWRRAAAVLRTGYLRRMLARRLAAARPISVS